MKAAILAAKDGAQYQLSAGKRRKRSAWDLAASKENENLLMGGENSVKAKIISAA
jgi:hypothetical protein